MAEKFISEKPEAKVGILEGILFASGEPVKKKKLKAVLSLDENGFLTLIEDLKNKLKKPESGLSLIETDKTLQLVSKNEYFSYIKEVLEIQKQKTLTKAGSEVLAIIAYNGPITRVEIDSVRGVNSSAALQRLTDQGLVKEVGKKAVPGSPSLYETTDYFLRLTGLKNLEELPDFEKFKNA